MRFTKLQIRSANNLRDRINEKGIESLKKSDLRAAILHVDLPDIDEVKRAIRAEAHGPGPLEERLVLLLGAGRTATGVADHILDVVGSQVHAHDLEPNRSAEALDAAQGVDLCDLVGVFSV